MWKKFARLFVIKTRWEAWFIIYALGLGGSERGFHYMEIYPGAVGYLFFAACTGAVFMAGAKLLDATRPHKPGIERRKSFGAQAMETRSN
jgi:hypothetical protein